MTIDGNAIEMAARDLDLGLVPAGPAQVTAELTPVFAILGCPAGMDSEAAATAYLDAFADVPLDILRAACRAAIQTCRFPPKPADIRDHVSGPLARRSYERRRLETAALKWRQGEPARRRAAEIAAEKAERIAAGDDWEPPVITSIADLAASGSHAARSFRAPAPARITDDPREIERLKLQALRELAASERASK